MIGPSCSLWLFAIGFAVASILLGDDQGMSKRADLASGVALPLILASWVLSDAQKRGKRLCYDYGSFVFFAWPVIVPVYLVQTRGVRAFVTLLCFMGIMLTPMLSASVVRLIRELLLP
jgi:hypothetical protein